MAIVTYDWRFRDPKLYALEALKVGIGAPLAKPRTALGATHTATDNVAHPTLTDKNVIFPTHCPVLPTWPVPYLILYTTHVLISFQSCNTHVPYKFGV